jgi:hypothetical protein
MRVNSVAERATKAGEVLFFGNSRYGNGGLAMRFWEPNRPCASWGVKASRLNNGRDAKASLKCISETHNEAAAQVERSVR